MRKLLPLAITLALASPCAAADGWSAQLRYRHEAVDDAAFARDARPQPLALLAFLREPAARATIAAYGYAVAD